MKTEGYFGWLAAGACTRGFWWPGRLGDSWPRSSPKEFSNWRKVGHACFFSHNRERDPQNFDCVRSVLGTRIRRTDALVTPSRDVAVLVITPGRRSGGGRCARGSDCCLATNKPRTYSIFATEWKAQNRARRSLSMGNKQIGLPVGPGWALRPVIGNACYRSFPQLSRTGGKAKRRTSILRPSRVDSSLGSEVAYSTISIQGRSFDRIPFTAPAPSGGSSSGLFFYFSPGQGSGPQGMPLVIGQAACNPGFLSGRRVSSSQ